MENFNLVELNCQRCGGNLEESGGAYVCVCCGKRWLAENLRGFTDMLEACEQALRGQRTADIANLRRLLWEQTHKNLFQTEKLKGCAAR